MKLSKLMSVRLSLLAKKKNYADIETMIKGEYYRGASMNSIATAAKVHPDIVCKLLKSYGLTPIRGGTYQSIVSARAAVRKLHSEMNTLRMEGLPDVSEIKISPDESPCTKCPRRKMFKSHCYDICPAIAEYQRICRRAETRMDYDAADDRALYY